MIDKVQIDAVSQDCYYHISAKDLGHVVTLKAKIPAFAAIDEPKIKRVCFSRSILGCLKSIDHGIQPHVPSSLICLLERIEQRGPIQSTKACILNPAVYATNSNTIVPAPDICDYTQNKEHWSLNDIRVVRIGYLDVKENLLGQNLNYIGVSLSQSRKSDLTKEQYKIIKGVLKNICPIENV